MTDTVIDTRPNLFDWARGQEARDAGIAQVEGNTSMWWKDRAAESVRHCAHTLGKFTSDDVWMHMESREINSDGVEPRAMGAVFKAAQREGLIEPTSDFRRTVRVAGHCHPVLVWQKKPDR